MKWTPILKRYAILYLPPLILGDLFLHIGLEGLLPALDGEIPKLKGPERLILLAHSPFAFWQEVAVRSFMLLMAPVVAFAWAFMRKSDHDSGRLILGRYRRQAALDNPVRGPLEP